jgi:hypothetical protein
MDKQIETREISETELDGVAGGIAVGGINVAPATSVDTDVTAPVNAVVQDVVGAATNVSA